MINFSYLFMNELLFFLHLFLIFSFGVIALKLGKSYLITWVAIQAILANLFVVKQMFFFHFNVTCSDVFAIGSILGLNLLQEYFNKKTAQKALWGAFFAMLFFTAMSQMHLLYAPSIYDNTHDSFTCIFAASPRLFAASVLVFLITQHLDLRLFQMIKQRCHFLPFAVRSGIATAFSQLTDTVLFSILGLWGLVSSLWDIILISFLIKLLLVSSLTFLLTIVKKLVGNPARTVI